MHWVGVAINLSMITGNYIDRVANTVSKVCSAVIVRRGDLCQCSGVAKLNKLAARPQSTISNRYV